jgi:hypothetical protein
MCVCKYFSLCVVCVNIFLKKKKKIYLALCDRPYPMRSIAYTGFTLHCAIARTLYVWSHTRACVQTHLHLFERRGPLHTHTQHECYRTHVCTMDRMRSEPSRDLFRSLSPLLPFIFTCAVHTSPTFLSSPSHPSPPNHHSTATQTLPSSPHHLPSHHSHHPHFHFFSHFLTTPIFHHFPHFVHIFTCYTHKP